MKRNFKIRIPSQDTKDTTFAGYITSGNNVPDVMKKDVSNAYRKGGVSWTKNNKNYHSEDVPQYSDEQKEHLLKYGEPNRPTGNIYGKGKKPEEKPKHGYKRTVDVSDKSKIKEARHGYHGYIYKPTMFLAGEAGREYVSISPKKRKKSNSIYDFDFMRYFK